MALTTAQKNELANRLVAAQSSGNYGSFNELVKQLRLTQADLLSNFPAINQAGINEQIARGAVVPTTAPNATTYTQAQISKAIQDSLAAGYTVQQAKMGAMNNFGISESAFNAALDQVQQAPSAFSDARVAQAIRDSLAQGFTLEQARQGALNNYGVGQSQFDRAMQLVDRASMQFRGSAPTYQFPGLLADRQQMPTGAQRFITGTPGSLLYDVPKVQNAEFVFQPGAFDYEAIRDQLGTGTKQAVDSETIANSNALAAYNAANQIKPVTTPVTPTPTVTPTITPTVTTPTTYTDARVAQALRESMAQGFSLSDSIAGAMRVYGVPTEQAYRAADIVALEQKRTPTSAGLLTATETTPVQMDTGLLGIEQMPIETAPAATQAIQPVVPIQSPQSTFSDAQVAQAILDSLGQGFTMDQARQGALANFGVGGDQFGRAVGMLPSMGYTIGQGFR